MENPTQGWFCWGITTEKKFNKNPWNHKSFYGVGTGSYWNLGGKEIYGLKSSMNGKIRARIGLQHFKMKKGEVDIYLDVDKRIFKLCVVGACDKEGEVYIDGLVKPPNNDGWVPHLTFASAGPSQQVRVCSIDSECYGKKFDIQWE